MAMASTIAAVLLSLALMGGTNGRVSNVEADSVQIAVNPGEEPALGSKIEVYFEAGGVSRVLATGEVVEVRKSMAVARLDKGAAAINKNDLVRISPKAKTEPAPAPAPPGTRDKPELSPSPPIVGPLPTLPPDFRPKPVVPTPAPMPAAAPPPAPVSVQPTPTVPSPLPPTPVVPVDPTIVVPAVVVPRPAEVDFGATLKHYQNAVVIVGDSDRRAHGTGFVISKKHRLIATNAHVADLAKTAVLNETRTAYKVVQIWYHPGVLRTLDDGVTLLQSKNPSDGAVDAECADVAILKLEAGGPDLPAEVRLAAPARAQQILGESIGIFGFPGYQEDQGFDKELYASATFVKGGVSRLSGLGHQPEATLPLRHSVQYDARTYGGFSGSPVFLSTGEVVAIHNHSHHDARGERNLGGGLRVDVLWELLQLENMMGMVAGDPVGLVQRPSFQLPEDPRLAKFRKAKQLVDESAALMTRDEFTHAERLLEDAIRELPDYWRPYHQMSKNKNHIATDHWHSRNTTNAQKIEWTKESLNYLTKATDAWRSGFGGKNRSLELDTARDLITLGRVANNDVAFEKAVTILDDDSIRRGMNSKQLSHLLALRGAAKSDLGKYASSLDDLNQAIRLTPDAKDYYLNRAWVLDKMGQTADAARDRAMFRTILNREHHHNHQH